MLLLSKRYSKKYRNNKRAFINLIKINAKQFDKLEVSGDDSIKIVITGLEEHIYGKYNKI